MDVDTILQLEARPLWGKWLISGYANTLQNTPCREEMKYIQRTVGIFSG